MISKKKTKKIPQRKTTVTKTFASALKKKINAVSSGKKTMVEKDMDPRVKSSPQGLAGNKKVVQKKKPVARIPQPQKPQVNTPIIEDTLDLPQSYSITRVTLLARDPYTIHAYWEIASSSIERVKSQIGSQINHAAYVLRMYDVTLKDFNGYNANHWFDIDIGFEHSNNWYVNLWSDGTSYCADLGIRTLDGRFFALARSNVVTTPRAQTTERCEMVWMDVGEEKGEPFIFVEEEKGASKKAGRRKMFLTEDDIRAYYSRLFPLLRKVLSARLRGMRFFADSKSVDRALERVMMGGLSRREFMKRMLLGSSAEFMLQGAGAGGASESLL